jgi:hypothetical protein
MPLRSTAKLRNTVMWLLIATLALPVVALVLAWAGGLLRAMGDVAGAIAVGYVVTACQVVWAVCLVGLLITLAIVVVNDERAVEKPIVDEELE